MKFPLIAALMALVGCSDSGNKAAAMSEFIKACATPVKAVLTVQSSGSNSVKLECGAFKPFLGAGPAPKQEGASE